MLASIFSRRICHLECGIGCLSGPDLLICHFWKSTWPRNSIINWRGFPHICSYFKITVSYLGNVLNTEAKRKEILRTKRSKSFLIILYFRDWRQSSSKFIDKLGNLAARLFSSPSTVWPFWGNVLRLLVPLVEMSISLTPHLKDLVQKHWNKIKNGKK